MAGRALEGVAVDCSASAPAAAATAGDAVSTVSTSPACRRIAQLIDAERVKNRGIEEKSIERCRTG
jgi:hypothetical protein